MLNLRILLAEQTVYVSKPHRVGKIVIGEISYQPV